VETLQPKREAIYTAFERVVKVIPIALLTSTGGNLLEPRQKVMMLLIGVTVIALSVQVAAATTYCPNCQVHYSDVMTVSTPASTSQDAPTHAGLLSLLDPLTAFTSSSQVNIAATVLQLL